MQRLVERELLDDLPAHDARAVRSRRDLRRVNAWMRNPTLAARALKQLCAERRPEQLIDLGAGDGWFFLSLSRELPPDWRDIPVLLVDRQTDPAPECRSRLKAAGWKVEWLRQDVFDFVTTLDGGSETAAIANLFLHHFTRPQLESLFGPLATSVTTIVACEPRRFGWSACAAWAVGLIGGNAVTRHDARVSVRAGFRGRELSSCWPRPEDWFLEERAAGLLSHLFTARRKRIGILSKESNA